MEWKFRYRAYKKERKIQLKPFHDNQKHFSIVWCKSKADVSLDDFILMDTRIRELITLNGCKLSFRIVKPTTNCTYGRFDSDFEALINQFRHMFTLCTDKDLPLHREEHQHLKSEEVWDESHPFMFHIHSRDETDVAWQHMMRDSPKDTIVTCDIELLKTE